MQRHKWCCEALAKTFNAVLLARACLVSKRRSETCRPAGLVNPFEVASGHAGGLVDDQGEVTKPLSYIQPDAIHSVICISNRSASQMLIWPCGTRQICGSPHFRQSSSTV